MWTFLPFKQILWYYLEKGYGAQSTIHHEPTIRWWIAYVEEKEEVTFKEEVRINKKDGKIETNLKWKQKRREGASEGTKEEMETDHESTAPEARQRRSRLLRLLDLQINIQTWMVAFRCVKKM
jgi:hypothetical protein